MKFCGMNGPSESEVESLLMSPCWSQTTQNGGQDQYLLDGHKLLLEHHDLDSQMSDSDNNKSSMDVLDNLLLNSSSMNSLSELKPLPPFTGYTGHLSINGISGHHYHAIAQRLPDDSNNNFTQSAYVTTAMSGNGGSCGSTTISDHHNIVSSSTCLTDSVLNSDGGGGGGGNGQDNNCLTSDVKLFSDSQLDTKLYSVADSCIISDQSGIADSLSSGGVRIYADAKDLSEYVDMNSIDDIAAIIGSAIADTTVPNQMDHDDGNDTRESWMDLDAWIDGNCIQQDGKLIVSQQDALSDFILPHSPPSNNTSNNNQNSSTLQNLLTHGYMPLLQNRLQNGPPIKSEAPSSTSYCNELTSSTSISPPGSVVSTTDNLMMNGRYISNAQQSYNSMSSGGMKPDGLCSPDLMGNYPHTTTITPSTGKTKRPRTQKKHQQHQMQHQSAQNSNNNNNNQMSAVSPSSVSFNANELSGLLGKEKPVHRCGICNRGFLNKSNIKVHLRTHTGEKPFRCDVCAKAFRQKAHLLKHQQIHKRIGRD